MQKYILPDEYKEMAAFLRAHKNFSPSFITRGVASLVKYDCDDLFPTPPPPLTWGEPWLMGAVIAESRWMGERGGGPFRAPRVGEER